jgi:hypothetical protein
MPLVDDGDGHLGRLRVLARPDIACHSKRGIASSVEGDERFVVVVIDLGEIGQHGLAQLGDRGEEAPVPGLGAQALIGGTQGFSMARSDGADPHVGPVSQSQRSYAAS